MTVSKISAVEQVSQSKAPAEMGAAVSAVAVGTAARHLRDENASVLYEMNE